MTNKPDSLENLIEIWTLTHLGDFLKLGLLKGLIDLFRTVLEMAALGLNVSIGLLT